MHNWKNISQNLWDNNAKKWNERSVSMWTEGSRKTVVPIVKEFMNPGESLVDLGCGDGFGSHLLQQNGLIVSGVDLSSVMIELAENRGENHPAFIQGDLQDLPYENQVFDGAVAINSFEWTEQPIKAVKELKRILKKEGKAFVGILGPTAMPRENSFNRLLDKEVSMNTMMPWEFKRLVLLEGFQLLDERFVWKKDMKLNHDQQASSLMKQSVCFMTIFILQR